MANEKISLKQPKLTHEEANRRVRLAMQPPRPVQRTNPMAMMRKQRLQPPTTRVG